MFIRASGQSIQVAPFWLDGQEAPAETSLAVTLGSGETKEGVSLQIQRD